MTEQFLTVVYLPVLIFSYVSKLMQCAVCNSGCGRFLRSEGSQRKEQGLAPDGYNRTVLSGYDTL